MDLRELVQQQYMTIFSIPGCFECDELRASLGDSVPPETFVKLDKTSPHYPEHKRQLVEMIGRDSFAFPQVFINGKCASGH